MTSASNPLRGLATTLPLLTCRILTLSAEFDGRAVREDLGRALREFSRIVAHTDHDVGSDLVSVLDPAVESLHSRVFTDVRELLDVAAHDRLKAAYNTAANAGRTDDDTSNDAEILGDRSTLDLGAGGDDHKFCSDGKIG